MILVADCGSTKCDWVLSSDTEIHKTSTMGFNPFFHSIELVASVLEQEGTLSKYKSEVKSVYYYGAGCSSKERNLIIEKALAMVFKNADKIIVEHDMVGAVLATCRGEPGIVCILGTGSNSCYYDGEAIHQPILALGHILGDEGSGAYFGRKLLRAFMRNQLPFEIRQCIIDAYGQSEQELLAKVYRQEHLNVFLASVMKNVARQENHPYIQKMVKEGLSEFAKISILCHPRYREVPVHFVGSIAYHFRPLLEEVALIHGFKLGNFTKRPVDELTRSILENEFILGNHK